MAPRSRITGAGSLPTVEERAARRLAVLAILASRAAPITPAELERALGVGGIVIDNLLVAMTYAVPELYETPGGGLDLVDRVGVQRRLQAVAAAYGLLSPSFDPATEECDTEEDETW